MAWPRRRRGGRGGGGAGGKDETTVGVTKREKSPSGSRLCGSGRVEWQESSGRSRVEGLEKDIEKGIDT